MRIVICKNCSAELFISDQRAPICGKCGNRLVELSREQTRKTLNRSILLASLAGLASMAFYFRDELRTRLPALWRQAPAIDGRVAWVVAVVAGAILVLALAMRRRPRTQTQKTSAIATPHVLPGSNIGAKINRLARQSWGSREEIAAQPLHLSLHSVNAISSHNDLIKMYLHHVARVAPKLTVPMMVPRIVTEQLCNAAGKFVEEDGWVKIAVGTSFFANRPAAQAILCHELCHYVLEANGIREQPTLENERMTDAAIFVFGMGDLFLAGYQTSPNRQYRDGHRLGYLTDREYRFARHHVDWLRKSEDFLRTVKGRRDDWTWDRSLR
jgi:hypothetical protein